MTPYRDLAPCSTDADPVVGGEEVLIGLLCIIVGAIPTLGALATNAPFGAEPTLGLGLLLAGAAAIASGLLLRRRA